MNDRKINIHMSQFTSPSLSPHRLDPVLFEKIVDLLAEVLVLDYQSHPNITDILLPNQTVNSCLIRRTVS